MSSRHAGLCFAHVELHMIAKKSQVAATNAKAENLRRVRRPTICILQLGRCWSPVIMKVVTTQSDVEALVS